MRSCAAPPTCALPACPRLGLIRDCAGGGTGHVPENAPAKNQAGSSIPRLITATVAVTMRHDAAHRGKRIIIIIIIYYSWNGGRAEAVCAGGKGVRMRI